MRENITYREAVAFGEQMLKQAGISDVKTDAWLLFEIAAKIDRNFYYLHLNEEVPKERMEGI